MKKYDYLIVGAGFFGAVFAERMISAGKKCLVIDKRDHIAGNAYTENICGINTHIYGAHIFHTSDEKVWQYVNRFAKFNDFINSPVANFNGEIYNLPFNMNTFAKMWNISMPDEARKIIERQKRESGIGEPKNLEEQAISLVGRDIYEKLIKGYTEKQWGRKCSELPDFIIKRIPVRFTYDNNYFSDKYQGIPIGGYTEMVKKMLAGCDIMLGKDYFSDRDNFDAIAEKIVYTGSIDEFFGEKFGALEYRSLKFERKILDEENFQGVAVMNYTDDKTPFTRIIEHKHFERASSDKTVISYEYPVKWQKGMEAYYPVNDPANQKLYAEYEKLAKGFPRYIFGGRLAEYKYYDMDKVISSALSKAEEEIVK